MREQQTEQSLRADQNTFASNSIEDFADHDAEDSCLPKEIVEGLVREGQLSICAGVFGVGKSPLVTDLGVHVATGTPWCGRSVLRRPVIILDFETPSAVYRQNVRRIVDRAGIERPSERALMILLQHSNSIPRFGGSQWRAPVRFVRNLLLNRPNALLIVDPIELLIRFDKVNGVQVLRAYSYLRQVLLEFPEAALLGTFNLRKSDRRADPPNLLTSPRDWLEEIAGSIELLNRSDVRLGFAFHPEDPDIRVLSGIRRGEDMHPILLRQAGVAPDYAGFELAVPCDEDFTQALTSRQREQWRDLPDSFRFDEAADKIVPRASLYRLVQRTRSLGVLDADTTGRYHKRVDIDYGSTERE